MKGLKVAEGEIGFADLYFMPWSAQSVTLGQGIAVFWVSSLSSQIHLSGWTG